MRILFIGVLCASLQAAISPYAGSKACAECHEPVYRKQSLTNHARALQRIEGSRLADLLKANPVAEPGGYRFSYKDTPGGLSVEAMRGGARAGGLLEWAFGTGQVGMTAVGRYPDGRYFEHRISYYAQAGQLGITPGQPPSPPLSAEQALGLVQVPQEATRCFRCHATDVDAGPVTPGVLCERCHGPGRSHIEAVRAARSGRSIVNPARFPAKASIEMCGDCHRLPARSDPTPERTEPISVRFQPVGLLSSRCFQESKQLRCSTCHDPHADAVRNDGMYYTAKCLSCHVRQLRPAVNQCRRLQRADCLPCHMRRTSPYPHFTFTDHRIRVY